MTDEGTISRVRESNVYTTTSYAPGFGMNTNNTSLDSLCLLLLLHLSNKCSISNTDSILTIYNEFCYCYFNI